MALKRKYSICGLFILILGLVSCSQDKEINYQPAPVAGFNVGALDPERKMQWAADIRELDLGGELTIDILNKQATAQNSVTGRVQSWCNTDTTPGELYKDFHFHKKLAVPILEVLSDDALLSLSSAPLTCRITVTITDSFSSQAIYQLENISIKNSVQFTNIPEIVENSAPLIYEKIKTENIPVGERQHLRCEDFQKISSDSVSWEQLMNSAATDMAQWTKALQNCRLLVKRNGVIRLSSQFQMVFPPQDIQVRAELNPVTIPSLTLSSRKVVSIFLSNPNNFSVTLKLDKIKNNRFIFLPVYADVGSVGYWGEQRDFPFHFSLPSTQFLKTFTEDMWILEIPANGQVLIEGSVIGTVFCDTRLRLDPFDPLLLAQMAPLVHSHPFFVGIHFGFDFKTQFSTHLVNDQWQEISINKGDLAAQANQVTPYFDLFYEEVRAFFGRGFNNSAQTTDEFISTIRRDMFYDRCVVK